VLTLFTVPKPFRGHIGDVQRNAIESWRALREDVQVVLVGDEEGVEQAARDAHVEHVGGLATSGRGTPRLDSAFARTATVARWRLWCFVNADIVFFDDFPRAIERVASRLDDFLLIGECRDLPVPAGATTGDLLARARLQRSARERGRPRGHAALDYFVFPRGLFDPMPPFLVGRAGFDNWLVWRARAAGRPVVDATRSVVAIHQTHGYSHVAGGRTEAYSGREADLNRRLAGGKEHLYSLHDATHRLHSVGRPVRYWGSAFRVRERARRARWRLAARIGARRARKGLERPVHLVGIFPYPRSETTLLLDALHRASNVDLDVLYASRAPGAGSSATQPLRHVHWFPRSLRVPLVDRFVGRDYPISWTIWRSLRRLRPDCTIIAGPNTFAAQAAVVWCAVRKVPFVLLVDEGQPAPIPDRGDVRRVLRSVVARNAHGVVVPWSAGGRTAAAATAEDVLRLARSALRGEDSPAGA
jgi:hypothetical protein